MKIIVNCSKKKAIITMEVNCIGIPKNDKEKIFEMLYRCTKLSNSAGLGRFIVKENLAKFGGSVEHEIELKKETIFTAMIPNKI